MGAESAALRRSKCPELTVIIFPGMYGTLPINAIRVKEMRGQVSTFDSAAKPPRFWDQRVEGEGLIMPSSALGG